MIPDSKELRQAWACPETGMACTQDQDRVTIDLGYLREILRTLEECQK